MAHWGKRHYGKVTPNVWICDGAENGQTDKHTYFLLNNRFLSGRHVLKEGKCECGCEGTAVTYGRTRVLMVDYRHLKIVSQWTGCSVISIWIILPKKGREALRQIRKPQCASSRYDFGGLFKTMFFSIKQKWWLTRRSSRNQVEESKMSTKQARALPSEDCKSAKKNMQMEVEQSAVMNRFLSGMAVTEYLDTTNQIQSACVRWTFLFLFSVSSFRLFLSHYFFVFFCLPLSSFTFSNKINLPDAIWMRQAIECCW